LGGALEEAVGLLGCPECGAALELLERSLLCLHGHSFDVARQGYVSLLTGAASKIVGDSAEMLAARAAFQDAGFFDPIADAIADVVAPDADAVAEIGAGTGFYLAALLEARPEAVGVGLDISKAAARRCAGAHPRAASVVADVWRQLPIRTGVLRHVLSVFAPRNAEEVHRVLAADGTFVVVTPTARHLVELIEPLGMVRVDEDKPRRLGESLSARFERVSRGRVEYAMVLARPDIEAVVAMGPSAHHLAPAQRAARIAALPAELDVTASVNVSVYRKR
jgi:23S rRNA (guanine745-N1)-methyltransferase